MGRATSGLIVKLDKVYIVWCNSTTLNGEIKMYKVIWWDAYGNPHTSELMDYSTALIMRASMHESQEAELMFIWVRK